MDSDKKPLRIDIHHHLCSLRYVEEVSEKVSLRPIQQKTLRNGTPDKAIEDMDRAGVTSGIISLTTPGVWFGDDAQARRLSRECNEYAAKAMADHPGRFGLFATLPLPDIEGSLREIDYAMDVLKADGIGLYSSYGVKHLGDPVFEPILAELNRRKAIAFVHPVRPDVCCPLLPEMPEALFEYGIDTTRTIASLVFSGAASRHADIRFIFSHGGGTMPYMMWRFLGWAKVPEVAAQMPYGVEHELKKFYYDTAQAAMPGTLASLTNLVSISHILFGTDFPYGTAAEHVAGLATCGLSPEDLRAIDYENALRLLPRLEALRG